MFHRKQQETRKFGFSKTIHTHTWPWRLREHCKHLFGRFLILINFFLPNTRGIITFITGLRAPGNCRSIHFQAVHMSMPWNSNFVCFKYRWKLKFKKTKQNNMYSGTVNDHRPRPLRNSLKNVFCISDYSMYIVRIKDAGYNLCSYPCGGLTDGEWGYFFYLLTQYYETISPFSVTRYRWTKKKNK